MSKKSHRSAEQSPIRILARDPEDQFWVAARDGEPAFKGVGDLGDAINASSTRGDVPILVSEAVYEQMHSYGDAWYPVPKRVWVE